MANEIVKLINEQLDDLVDRYKSVQNLPKIGRTLSETISIFMKIVEMNHNIDSASFKEIVISDYRLSRNTVNTVLPTLERVNILMIIDDTVRLTNMSKKYLENNDIAYICRGYLEDHFGFLEMLLLIAESKYDRISKCFNEWVKLYEKGIGERNINTHKSQFNKIYRYLVDLNLVIKREYLIINDDLLTRCFRTDVF